MIGATLVTALALMCVGFQEGKSNGDEVSKLLDQAKAEFEARHVDAAIALYTRVIELDPRNVKAYRGRGGVYALPTRKDSDKAIADYAKAIELYPQYQFALRSLAWIRAVCPDATFRDGPRAVELATKACELSKWQDAHTIQILAAAYGETGDFVKAAEWQEKANGLFSQEADKQQGAELLDFYRAKQQKREGPVE